MVRHLYDIAFQFKEYVVVGVLVVISIALLAFNDTAQIRTLRTLTLASVGFLQETFSVIPNYFGLRSENRALREWNLTLADEVNRLREARLENIRLRKLLGLRERVPFHYVGASVVGKHMQMLRTTITIDAGRSQGVRPDMPIVTDQGLVGKVVAADNGYAIGQILLNRELRVSAKVQRSRVDGIVRWDGGSTLSLQNVVKTFNVQTGDVVTTSEYSNIYPRGLRIGVVSATRQAPGSLFQSIDIAPAVDFARLEEVFVILSVPDSSRAALEQPFNE
jgi:rod shape-determining protein MreC